MTQWRSARPSIRSFALPFSKITPEQTFTRSLHEFGFLAASIHDYSLRCSRRKNADLLYGFYKRVTVLGVARHRVMHANHEAIFQRPQTPFNILQ
jgi:hypothetical protein